MGKHFLLNLYDCSQSLLDNETFIIKLIEDSAILCGATILKTISHKFKPVGVTAICLLSESHISIHTWPEEFKAACDVYTCGNTNPEVACENIIESLNCKFHELQRVDR